MADRTARDAVRDVAFERFVEWDDSHTLADAVLSALGIDPDTDPRRIEAGLAVIAYIDDSAPGELDAALSAPNGWTGRQIVNLVWSTRSSEVEPWRQNAAARLEEQ